MGSVSSRRTREHTRNTQSIMVVLVTGSNKGIGFHIARLFGKSGEKQVVITSRNAQNGEETLKKLQSEFPNTEYFLTQLDLVDAASRKNAVEFIKSKFGKVDVLINNAGFAYKGNSTAPNSEQATVTFDINFYSTKAFTEEMEPFVKSRIVTVASMVSQFSFPKCSEEVRNIVR